MTFDEVRRHIDEGGVIRCENVYQREEAVKFLVDIGFELLPAAARWLEKNRTDASFCIQGLTMTNLKSPAGEQPQISKRFHLEISKP